MMEKVNYLKPASFIDCDHPAVQEYAYDNSGKANSVREIVLNLYYAIRDDIRYDPYMPISLETSYRASNAVIDKRGWCVPKAALLSACCRIHGIPSRPGYADVKNHLATDRLLDLLGTDLFAWHSYCEILIDGVWIKATPAFNLSLCKKFGLKPLEFDGKTDSLFHEFDASGNKHMEYVRDRGTYADVPFRKILDTFKVLYKPEYIKGSGGDFHQEATNQYSRND